MRALGFLPVLVLAGCGEPTCEAGYVLVDDQCYPSSDGDADTDADSDADADADTDTQVTTLVTFEGELTYPGGSLTSSAACRVFAWNDADVVGGVPNTADGASAVSSGAVDCPPGGATAADFSVQLDLHDVTLVWVFAAVDVLGDNTQIHESGDANNPYTVAGGDVVSGIRIALGD